MPFIDGCLEDSCGFDVLMRGEEFKVFLLHHLVSNLSAFFS